MAYCSRTYKIQTIMICQIAAKLFEKSYRFLGIMLTVTSISALAITSLINTAQDSVYLTTLIPIDISFLFCLILGILSFFSASSPKVLVKLSPVLLGFSLRVILELVLKYLVSIFCLLKPSLEEAYCSTRVFNQILCRIGYRDLFVVNFLILLALTGIIGTVIMFTVSFNLCNSFVKSDLLPNSHDMSSRTLKNLHILIILQITVQIVHFIVYLILYLVYNEKIHFYDIWRFCTITILTVSPIVQLILFKDAQEKVLKLHAMIAIAVCDILMIVDIIMAYWMGPNELPTIFMFPVTFLLQISVCLTCFLFFTESK